MRYFLKSLSTEYTDLRRVIRWFIKLRWVASGAVLSSLLVGRFLYHYVLPYGILYFLTGALILVNLSFTLYFYKIKEFSLSQNSMIVLFHVQICTDYILLFLLVYFTGFLENPFVYYFVFHIMLSSLIFPRRIISIYVSCLIILFALVSAGEFWHFLPHFSLQQIDENSIPYNSLILIRTFALCSTLTLAAYLIESIKERIAERGHRVELELDRYKGLDRAKSNFILHVTHELRGPIAALKGYHEMIQKGITGEISEKTGQTIERANHRTQNLLNIIDEMIDFGYMQSEEERQYARTVMDLAPVIQYNMDLFSTMARQNDIKMLSSCEQELTVAANRDLLNIILSNLITNAIKYSNEGTAILVSAQNDGVHLQLTIKDEGMGIEPEEIKKIFEEFYRTRRAREIERNGTGLGLSIVQKAAKLLDGRIMIYSEINKGSSFNIYLPKKLTNSVL